MWHASIYGAFARVPLLPRFHRRLVLRNIRVQFSQFCPVGLSCSDLLLVFLEPASEQVLHGLQLCGVCLAHSDAFEKGVVVLCVLDALFVFLHECSPAFFDLFVEVFDFSPRLWRAVEQFCDSVDGFDLFLEFFELGSLPDGLILFQKFGGFDPLFFFGMERVDFSQSLHQVCSLVFLDGLLLYNLWLTLKFGQ